MIPRPEPAKPVPISLTRLLAVEGRDEQEFMERLLEAMKLDGTIEVRNLGGNEQFPSGLKALKAMTGFGSVEVLGVIRDAEGNPARSAFDSVVTALKGAALPAPAVLGAVAAGPPRVSVYILPNCRDAGMLEDLCLDAAGGDPAMPCVEAFVECVANLPGSPRNVSKARMGAFLASRAEFVREVGRAAQKGAFDLDHPAFDGLRSFLRSLCDD